MNCPRINRASSAVMAASARRVVMGSVQRRHLAGELRVVFSHVFLDRAEHHLRPRQSEGIAEFVESREKSGADAHVDLFSLDLFPGHHQHGVRFYLILQNSTAYSHFLLACASKSYTILVVRADALGDPPRSNPRTNGTGGAQ